MAGDPANVRAPDRDVEGSPATPPLSHRRCCTPRTPPVGAPAPTTPYAWSPSFPTEWSAAPVAPSLPDRPPPLPRAPMTAGSHRPVPGLNDQGTAGPGRSPVRRRTRVARAPAMGRGRSRGTAPPRKFFHGSFSRLLLWLLPTPCRLARRPVFAAECLCAARRCYRIRPSLRGWFDVRAPPSSINGPVIASSGHPIEWRQGLQVLEQAWTAVWVRTHTAVEVIASSAPAAGRRPSRAPTGTLRCGE